jgi:polyferredoxin
MAAVSITAAVGCPRLIDEDAVYLSKEMYLEGHPLATQLRRISQIIFFLLFVWFLVRTKLGDISSADRQLEFPVNPFFKLDPLVALVNAVSGHAFYPGLAWALVILVPTFFLGRLFCGWFCPLGSLNQFLGSIRSRSMRRRALTGSNRYKNWQTAKYYLLIAGLLMALFHSSMAGWIDPLSLMVRSTGLSMLPAAASKKFVVVYQPHYWLSVLLGVAFLALLAMNLLIPRFWCRALCPLGALLGLSVRWSFINLHKDASTCNRCNRCTIDCQGGDSPVGGVPWHKTECLLCLNCVAACPHQSLQFRFGEPEQEVVKTILSRRKALAAVVAGLAVAPMLRAATGLGMGRDERQLRPPGSLREADFLARCIRCGECLRVCPNDCLQPAFTEIGLEGFWSPLLTPKIGYCEPSCVLCSQVCPTGAIQELSSEQKRWVAESRKVDAPVRVGTAMYDRGQCLPWAKGTDCVICVEWCPLEPKAIYTVDAVVVDREGKSHTVKQPHMDPICCVGCGACEYACPLPQPGVYVTNKGESRPN